MASGTGSRRRSRGSSRAGRWSPGPTGLEAIDALLGAVATRALRTRAVALEVGVGQAATVAELVRRAGFELVEKRRDLAGIERVVLGR